MKKILLSLVAALCVAVSALNAQSFSFGTILGSEGVGAQIAASFSPSIQARVGYAYMPYSLIGQQELNFQAWGQHPAGTTTLKEQKITGTASLLFDFFPGGAGFHITAGTMFGSGTLFQITNTKAMPSTYHTLGMDYYVEGKGTANKLYADAEGIYVAELRRNAVRPYIGIGFGSPFLSKGVSFTLDLGIEYTGGIGFYTDPSATGNTDLNFRLDTEGVQKLAYDMRGSQTQKSYDKYFKYIDKVYNLPVMPVLRLNLFFGSF